MPKAENNNSLQQMDAKISGGHMQKQGRAEAGAEQKCKEIVENTYDNAACCLENDDNYEIIASTSRQHRRSTLPATTTTSQITSELGALDLGQRLTNVNVKRYQKKIAKLDTKIEKHYILAKLMGSSSASDFYTSSDASSLHGGGGSGGVGGGGGGERKHLLGNKRSAKRHNKSSSSSSTTATTTTKTTTTTKATILRDDYAEIVEISSEALAIPKPANRSLRRRGRKRIQSIRRSLSRFSSKSAPD